MNNEEDFPNKIIRYNKRIRPHIMTLNKTELNDFYLGNNGFVKTLCGTYEYVWVKKLVKQKRYASFSLDFLKKHEKIFFRIL